MRLEIKEARIDKKISLSKDSIIEKYLSIIYQKDIALSLADSTLAIRTDQVNKYGYDNQVLEDKRKSKNTVIGVLIGIVIVDSILLYFK